MLLNSVTSLLAATTVALVDFTTPPNASQTQTTPLYTAAAYPTPPSSTSSTPSPHTTNTTASAEHASSPIAAAASMPPDTFAAAAAVAAMAASIPDIGQPLDRCHPYNIHFNCTADEYLLFSRGPPTVPWNFLLPVTVLYTAIFVAGCVGNGLVCWVIVRHPTMHTATNYYLFSLALSDLLYLLAGLPYDLSVFWWQYPYRLGAVVCKLRAWLSEAATYVSVLTILAFTAERYLAICHPLYVYAMGGFRRAARIIGALWLVSFTSALPFGVYSEISYLNYPPWDERDEARLESSAFCAMLDNPPGFPLWELSSLCFFALPMAVMVVLYGRIGLAIRRRSAQQLILGVQHGSVRSTASTGGGGASMASAGPRSVQSRKAIIRMLAAVCMTFFVSWAPFHAQRLMFLYAHDWEDYELLNVWLFSVAGLFYYVSCTVNPVLYNVMSNRYRRAFKETLFGRRGAVLTAGGLSGVASTVRRR